MFNIAHLDEGELLTQVASGNEYAFRKLFMAYHQQLGVHMLRITNSVELAEEVVQDVFLKIWLTRESLVGVDNFKAYLFVISKNHALNCLKKLAKERMLQKSMEDSSLKRLVVETTDTNMYYNLLDEAIDQLPPQQQKVYLLSRHGRLKYAEIADQLELSKETVKKYLQIATTSITDYVHDHQEVTVFLLLALKSILTFFRN
ncbi:sigma-70 family RNA polymerase sigma factor [Mucilaginibacter sp. SP1R1]|uniref:sigma-70 family RNA polymerase sigma factor n=1 Tax=Mucilaginibacter sp. SP1R1 TaxID=2723091 RepID=UPI0016113EDD|nr:sigma-70 family RNA polymerase sigma factor [Mucilaginibacter sp. SP1R1]MBB6148698.1 RNA polymerase sigma-70 factor (ECF subfamily) [Mucilaginibacter sp. SP1R1]